MSFCDSAIQKLRTSIDRALGRETLKVAQDLAPVSRMKPIPTDHEDPAKKAKMLAAAKAREQNLQARAAAKKADDEKRAYIREAVEAHGLRIRYAGDTTIAFRIGGDTSATGEIPPYSAKVVSVATSLRNPTDEYSKFEGRYLAIKNWCEGRRINLRVPVDFESAIDFVDFLAANVDDYSDIPEALMPAMRKIRDAFVEPNGVFSGLMKR